MEFKKLLVNGIGILIGGGLMYALVKKSGLEKNARTLSATIVEGGAITGGALVGYHLSNLVAARLLQEVPEDLPKQQAEALPSGSQPLETPSAEKAMGNVAAKVRAVTPEASQDDIQGWQVIDITKAKG
jgi:hypothetical protein